MLPIAAAALVGLALVHQASRIGDRYFDPDEFQHLHAAWCVSQGMVPYADFFEHHTPALSYVLAPILSLLDVEASADRAVAALFLARFAMGLVALVIVALTFSLARAVWDRTTAWAAVTFLATTLMFQAKTLEVRPDSLSVACLLLSLLLLVRALGPSSPDGRTARRLLVGAGLAAGIAILFTQKVLFALPGLAGAALWSALGRPLKTSLVACLEHAALFGAGVVVPLAATAAFFAAQGALGPFVELNLFYNLRWDARFSPLLTAGTLIRQNPLTVAFGVAGLAVVTARAWLRRRRGRRGEIAIVFGALSVGAGALVIPAPWPQYFLMGLPLLAILAGRFVVLGAGLVSRARSWPRDATATVVLVAVSLPSLGVMAFAAHRSAREQLEAIRYVMDHTRPDQTVLDGATGYGVFRPHAFFYGLLNWELRAMLSADETSRLVDDLRSGRIAPQIVALDDDLAYLSEELRAYVEENYSPAGISGLWMRRDDLTSNLPPPAN